MKENLEIELKCLLNHEQFVIIAKKLPFSLPKLQKNTYYDTVNGELQKRHWMCRIREAAGNFEFTLKTPADQGLNEFECPLISDDINDPIILSFFRHHGITSPLLPIGTSETYRRKYTDEYGEWCLDENEFGGVTDYELEYELSAYHKNAENRFRVLLESCNVKYVQAKTKFERMIMYKKDR